MWRWRSESERRSTLRLDLAPRKWMCWYFQSQLICMNALVWWMQGQARHSPHTRLHEQTSISSAVQHFVLHSSNLSAPLWVGCSVRGMWSTNRAPPCSPTSTVNRLHLELAPRRMFTINFCDVVQQLQCAADLCFVRFVFDWMWLQIWPI